MQEIFVSFGTFSDAVKGAYSGSRNSLKKALGQHIQSHSTDDERQAKLLAEAKALAIVSNGTGSFFWDDKDDSLIDNIGKGAGSARKSAAFHYLFLSDPMRFSRYSSDLNNLLKKKCGASIGFLEAESGLKFVFGNPRDFPNARSYGEVFSLANRTDSEAEQYWELARGGIFSVDAVECIVDLSTSKNLNFHDGGVAINAEFSMCVLFEHEQYEYGAKTIVLASNAWEKVKVQHPEFWRKTKLEGENCSVEHVGAGVIKGLKVTSDEELLLGTFDLSEREFFVAYPEIDEVAFDAELLVKREGTALRRKDGAFPSSRNKELIAKHLIDKAIAPVKAGGWIVLARGEFKLRKGGG